VIARDLVIGKTYHRGTETENSAKKNLTAD